MAKSSKKFKVEYECIYDSLSPEEKARADWNIEQAFDMIFDKAFDELLQKKSFPEFPIVDKK